MWVFFKKTRKGKHRNDVNLYNPTFKFLMFALGACLLLLACNGCATNAKKVSIQIPALLDVQMEYHETGSALKKD